jgi:cytidylate kinase
MIIAIDGPAAAGKGTLARALAARFALPFMDTGALYRRVAAHLLTSGADLRDAAAAEAAARHADLDALPDEALRTAIVGEGASIVAAMPGVRRALFDRQRAFALQPGGAVLDGRDIGTVVCPEADVKLFVSASPEERARRRLAELADKGEAMAFETMLAQVLARDARDSGRADAPLKPAADAHLLDTTLLSIDAAVEDACAIVAAARARSGA